MFLFASFVNQNHTVEFPPLVMFEYFNVFIHKHMNASVLHSFDLIFRPVRLY